jgi:hypothetical protein
MANGQVLNVPTGWDVVGDPNNPAFRSPAIIVPNAPNNIGSSIGINVAGNTGITGVYYRDLSGDKLIGTLSTDGKTFNLTKDGRSYLQKTYSTVAAKTFDSNAKAESWLNSKLLPVVNNQRATFLNTLYKDYTGNNSPSNLSTVPGFNGNTPLSGSSQTQVQPSPSTGGTNFTNSFNQLLTSIGVPNLDTLKLDKDLKFEFGKVDDVIKKMPLLNYPEDALYNKTQDHLSIAQYSYKPPRSNDIFGDALDTLRNGSKRTSPLKELLGMVNLPMPNNITDSNNVSWADDNMNNLSAALTSYVTNDPLKTLGGAAGLRAGASALGVGGGAAQIASLLGALADMKAFKTGATPAMKTLLGGAVNSQILGMLGVSVSPESILARGYGIVPNSNLELLFNAPTLREFTFQYRMSPRSRSEAKIINNIIRFFKQGMAAKKISSISGGGSAGAQSYFLGTPNVFQLQYKTTGGKTIKGVNRIKTCALTGFAMNYAADGNWAAYDEGQPVSVIMNMSFKELEPVYDTDYQMDIDASRLANKDQLQDLYPVSDEDVGY